MFHGIVRLQLSRMIGASLAIVAVVAITGYAAAQDLIKLKGDQAAIIFVVSSQGRSGDIQVRDAQHASPIWSTLLSHFLSLAA